MSQFDKAAGGKSKRRIESSDEDEEESYNMFLGRYKSSKPKTARGTVVPPPRKGLPSTGGGRRDFKIPLKPKPAAKRRNDDRSASSSIWRRNKKTRAAT